MDIIYLFKLLNKKKWIIAGITISCFLLAFVLTINIKRTYVSEAKLATGYTITKHISLEESSFNLYESNAKFNNLMESITSESVLSLLSYKLMLHDLTSEEAPFTNPYADHKNQDLVQLTAEEKQIAISLFKANLEKLKVLSTYDEFEKKLTEVLELYEYDPYSLSKVLSVYRVNLSDFVSIRASSYNPRLSAFMVNVLAEEFLRYDNIIYNNQTGQSVDMLTRQVEEARTRLNEKTTALENYKTTNNLINYDSETESKITKLSEYDEHLKEEGNNLRKLQISLSDVNQRIKESGLDTKSESRNRKIYQLREEIDQLNEKYINSGSQDPGLLSRINVKKDDLKELIIQQRATKTTDSDDLLEKQQSLMLDIRISQANLGSIKQSIFELKKGISGFSQHESSLKQLQKEVTLASEEYLTVLDKLNKAKSTATTSTNSIQIIQYGQPAGEPQSAKRGLIIILSGFVSCIVYVLGLMIAVFFDGSIRSPSRMKEKTEINLITSIPFLTKKQLQYCFSENVTIPNVKNQIPVFLQLNEFLKNIRFEIFKSGFKTILITSDADQDGKTIMAINIAKMIGLTSKSTLIIDMNFGNNFITKYYKGNDTSLQQVLDNPESLMTHVIETQNPSIHILGCTSGYTSPSEVIKEGQLTRLLEKAKEHYDYILIESASLNNSSSPKELEKYIDGIIPIYSASTTLKESDKETFHYLTDLGSKVIGIVLNKVRKENMDN